jgi:hypothetical protein
VQPWQADAWRVVMGISTVDSQVPLQTPRGHPSGKIPKVY